MKSSLFRFGLLAVVAVCLLRGALGVPGECWEAPAAPEDRRVDGSRLRLVHYNVEWLFYPEVAMWGSLERSLYHTQSIAAIVQQLDPDVLNLAEVRGCDALDVLLSYLPPDNGLLPYLMLVFFLFGFFFWLIDFVQTDCCCFLIFRYGAENQNVGLLTRIDPSMSMARTDEREGYPVEGSACCGEGGCGNGTKTQGVSKNSWTVLRVGGMEVLLVSAHLLAFPVEQDRCQRREAQALVLQRVVQSEGFAKGRQVIVAGDINDYDPTVEDAAQSVPTSRVLDILRNANATQQAQRLVNVGTLANASSHLQIYSAWWDQDSSCVNSGPQEDTLIDHILISEGLVPYVTAVKYMVGMYPSQTVLCNGNYSDHWPILVDFSFPSLPPSGSGPGTPASTIVLIVVVVAIAVIVAISIVIAVYSKRADAADALQDTPAARSRYETIGV